MINRYPATLARALLAMLACVLLAGNDVDTTVRIPQETVVRATLDNGLRVIIVRNTLAPVVATALNYQVGADEAPPGYPGTAHAQEHMMFRGSPGLSADQLADIASAMGGNFNADTRQTVTQYFFTVPAEDLDVVLHIEALRMQGVSDDEEAWDKERGAIEQEVAQDLSSPTYVLFTKLRATLFSGTAYAHDALGTRPSFDQTTAAMLRDFHAKWYAPNNAILVIVGDVEPQAALARVRELFGPISPRNLPDRPHIELGPVAPQSLAIDSDLPYGLQVVALRLPGLDSPDYAAAEVLVDVLKSQRGDLYGLVPQGKALATDFSYDPLAKAGLAYAAAAFPSGGDAKVLEAEMRAILAGVARDGVSPELVAAAKLQERRDAEFQKNSIAGLAAVWSEAVAVDGLDSPDDDLARIDRVTVEDVNRVARQYLDLEHAVTAVLTPRDSGKPVVGRGFGGRENFAPGETKPTQLPDWAQTVLSRLTVPESMIHPVVSRLDNGITLIVQPEGVSDAVSIYGHIKNRPELQVPAGKEGLSKVMGALFSYGSEKLDRVAFQRALDDIGAMESAGTDFSLKTLAGNLDRGVALLADNELHPAFPGQAFEVVRRQVAQTVAGQLTTPGYLSGRALRGAIYPHDDPALREALPRTVEALRLEDVRDYYQAVMRPDLATIVVIGKVTPKRARAVIEKYFGTWSATGLPPVTVLPPVPLNAPSIHAVPDASRVQDRVTLAENLGLTRANPDYYPLELGNSVLGGAFYSTRLTRDIRKAAGLVYSVQSSLELSQTRGVLAVQYACDPLNVSRVHLMIVRELLTMQKTPVTTDELQRAKALLLRRIPLAESSVDAIALGIVQRRSLDLPLDEPTIAARRYLALGASDVQAAFAKWVRPADFVRVSLGPSPQ